MGYCLYIRSFLILVILNLMIEKSVWSENEGVFKEVELVVGHFVRRGGH